MAPSLLGLNYLARTTLSVPVFLGLQLGTQWDLGNNMQFSGWARAAWKHELRPERSTESSFIAAPGFNFVVQGAQPSRDALRASIGARLQLDQTVSIHSSLDGDFARKGRGYTGSAGIKVAW